MATFQVEVPDDQVQLIGEAFQQQYNDPTPTDEDGKALTGRALVGAQIEATRQHVMSYINDIVRAHLVWQHQQTQPEIPDTPVVMS
jgi:hypothetical protein